MCFDSLDEVYFSNFLLNNFNFPINLFNLKTVDSTNKYLFDKKFNPNEFYLCCSEEQLQGKGRREKIWHSPSKKNLYLSIGFLVNKTYFNQYLNISLFCGIVVAEFLKSYIKLDNLKIKWPNDVYCNNKKICGILIETNLYQQNYYKLICGIGINVNMESKNISSISINQDWTSIFLETGNFYKNKTFFLTNFIKLFFTNLQKFTKFGFAYFINKYKQFDFLYNKKIKFILNDKIMYGTALGVTEDGYLIIKDNKQNIVTYSSITNIRLA